MNVLHRGMQFELVGEPGPILSRIRNVGDDGDGFSVRTEEIVHPSITVPKRKRLSPEKKQFLRECYEYVTEKSPLFEPFGRDGKNLQAKWREEKGYSFVDPVMSNLSSWGYLLKELGYIIQRPNGDWISTGKPWMDL